MKKPLNLKEYKDTIRNSLKEKRKQTPSQQRESANLSIFTKVITLDEFKKASTILTYVSTEIEVDTIKFIKYCFAQGKTVAVPRCISGTRNMDFYRINTVDELEVCSFGVREPVAKPETLLRDFSKSICIVPALGCDTHGYRIGYGGGYYDRFLENFHHKKIVIIYHNCLLAKMWHGKYDIQCDIIVTENIVKRPMRFTFKK